MKIVGGSKDFFKAESYLMDIFKSSVAIEDVEDGTEVEVYSYLLCETWKGGKPVVLMVILDTDKKAWVTQSQLFIRTFIDICRVMEGCVFSVRKISERTKEGVFAVNCESVPLLRR